jgi:glycosyltransferase involved in cell wall biosynthesis
MIPKISYVILFKNEFVEIQKLFKQLYTFKDTDDEVIIVYDGYETDDEFKDLNNLVKSEINTFIATRILNGDFAAQRNYADSLCTGDYIMHIDADELFNDAMFLKTVKNILQNNQTIDVFGFPRINTVDGITEYDVKKWHWSLDKFNRINFPDTQFRLYKNNHKINWVNKVHEHLVGFETITKFSDDDQQYHLYHQKNIDRQRKQNSLYDRINK